MDSVIWRTMQRSWTYIDWHYQRPTAAFPAKNILFVSALWDVGCIVPTKNWKVKINKWPLLKWTDHHLNFRRRGLSDRWNWLIYECFSSQYVGLNHTFEPSARGWDPSPPSHHPQSGAKTSNCAAVIPTSDFLLWRSKKHRIREGP